MTPAAKCARCKAPHQVTVERGVTGHWRRIDAPIGAPWRNPKNGNPTTFEPHGREVETVYLSSTNGRGICQWCEAHPETPDEYIERRKEEAGQ